MTLPKMPRGQTMLTGLFARHDDGCPCASCVHRRAYAAGCIRDEVAARDNRTPCLRQCATPAGLKCPSGRTCTNDACGSLGCYHEAHRDAQAWDAGYRAMMAAERQDGDEAT